MANFNCNKPEEIDRIVRTEFTNEFTESYIDIGDGTYMPIYYERYADDIKKLSVFNDDIFVHSFPKTGTTWTEEMVWLIANNCDFEGAKVDVKKRVPYLEMSTLYDMEKLDKFMEDESPPYMKDSVEFIKSHPRPRFIKTHLPFCLLPDEIVESKKAPKMVYVTRNPKDTCVSYFHHGMLLQGWTANLENFCKVFLAEKIMYGSFWKHVLGFWKQRNLPNLLIITYEDMKRNLPSVIRKVAKFLEKSLTDEQIEKLTEHLSFDSMKNNRAVNLIDIVNAKKQKGLTLEEDGSFIRSGKVGKYKEEMTPEIIEQFDAWTKKRVANTGFDKEYPYLL